MLSGCNHMRIQHGTREYSETRKENPVSVLPLLSFMHAFILSFSSCLLITYFVGGTEECCRGCCLLPETETLEFPSLSPLANILG